MVQVSAFTLSCLVVLPSFTQTANAQSGCNEYGCYDDDGNFDFYPIPVNPPEDDPWDPWGDTDPNPPTCDYLGDPDCDVGDSGGGGGGGGSNPAEDPDARACLDLYTMKDDDCLFDPVGKNEYNWNPFGTTFRNLFNPWASGFDGLPSGGFPDFGAPIQVYQNIIRDVSQAYWDNQSLASVNSAYWSAVDVFCIGFPEETTFGADRSDCYDDAYSVSLRLIPSFSDNAFTISQVEAYGVTVQHLSSGNPFANWAAGFFGDINKVKECKLWFDAKDQIPGCE